MNRLRQCLAVATVMAAVCAPSSAMGAPIVPPGNSAVNQYTQTIPTSGGNAVVNGKGVHSPSQVLGQRKAHKLDQRGPDGKAVAELAAATVTIAPGAGDPTDTSTGVGAADLVGSGSAHAGRAGGGSGSQHSLTSAAATGGGSSGFGQVLGQATGASSSGGLGPMLPLVILAGLLWCAAYSWRQRRTA